MADLFPFIDALRKEVKPSLSFLDPQWNDCLTCVYHKFFNVLSQTHRDTALQMDIELRLDIHTGSGLNKVNDQENDECKQDN